VAILEGLNCGFDLIFYVKVTFYDQALVLEAFVLTVATTMALTMYTLQSKKDYSSWGAGYVLFLKCHLQKGASLTLSNDSLEDSKFIFPLLLRNQSCTFM